MDRPRGRPDHGLGELPKGRELTAPVVIRRLISYALAVARPVNADAAATRRRILESATQLFSERGEAGSVREIARSAGVSLAMVHHYFGSKDGLYGACVDAMYAELAELRGHLMGALGRAAAPTELFERAVREGFRFACAHRPAMRLMMRGVVSRGAIDAARVDEFLVPFLEQASTMLSPLTGREPGALRLPLQSLVFLTGRYAIAEAGELMLITGMDDPDAALAAVEEHLVASAFALLGLAR